MNLFKAISPSNSRTQEIEFLLLAAWALLFPVKQSYLYFLGFSLLLAGLALRKVAKSKNIALTRFYSFLVLFNALLIFGAFFSPHPFKSLLFAGNILLVSLWFIFFYLEKEDMERYLCLAACVISLSSLVVIVAFALQGGRLPVATAFRNPILQGIVSALAVLVFLYALLRKYSHADAALLGLNLAAVIISASRAAVLGLAFFVAAMILARKKRWLVYFVSIMLLLILLPNPLRRRVAPSLYEGQYVLNRLAIWSMTARMVRHYPWTGVGPDLFAEAAPRFNFAQEKGSSRYGQVPESPHSDYWKVIVENGLPGLILVLLFLFFAIRRLLSPPWFELPKLLLAFLLAQMLLFNFIFNFFFILIFFLLLQDFLSTRQRFISLRPGARLFVSVLLVFVLVTLYLLPYVANRHLDAAVGEKDIARCFSLLKRAELLSPLDERPPLAKAGALRVFAARTGDIEAWTEAWENIRRAQQLNRNSVEALLAESALFREFLGKKIDYQALGEEVLEPLRRAEKLAPFNPFLKLQQAIVLRESGRDAEARQRAQAALDLEPNYVAAIMFIHALNGLPADDPALHERLTRIREKADHLKARPGSYLFKLHQLPAAAQGQGSAAMPSPRR